MDEAAAPENLSNAAWVIVPTRLTYPALLAFCNSLENLFRLNPFLTIKNWQQITDDEYQVAWENHSNASMIKFSGRLLVVKNKNELVINYSVGAKSKTSIVVENIAGGSQIKIVDDYAASGKEQLADVDKSLTAWGQSLQRFFNGYRYFRCIPGAKTVIEKFWLRCNPMGRRVIYILFVITVIELILLAGYVLVNLVIY